MVIKARLRELRDAAVVCLVGFLQVSANPFLEVGTSLGPRILLLSLDGVQRRESNTKGHFLDINFINDVVLVSNRRWKFKQLEEGVASVAPSLSELCCEGIRVGDDLGERKHSCLSVDGSRKFLGVLEDDVRVDLGEEPLTG